MAKVPLLPANPERVCWGCDKYCPADDLACGNGTIRTPHPCELFGDDWLEWADGDGRRTGGAAGSRALEPVASGRSG
jgi:hypothetical protein